MKIATNQYQAIVVGAGFAGATIANKLANAGKKVLLIDKRDHIGGNAYDYFDENGIIIHKYGPHIFHTNNDEVWDYLKSFTDYFPYKHHVLANIDQTLVPVPFNFKSIELCFDQDKANRIKDILLKTFPHQNRISILDLLNASDNILKDFGNFVYQKIFVYYTSKQWGIHPDKIDRSVINRVPVNLNYEDTYFYDKHQYMPSYGFTKIFDRMLQHDNITIQLSTNIVDHIEFKDAIYIDNEKFNGTFIYTGAIDELFNYQFGVLPYRSLDIVLEKLNVTYFQPVSVVNYTTSEKFTRISEYKYFLNQDIPNKTIIAKEYSKPYSINDNTDPYYPIINDENKKLYEQYLTLANKYQVHLCGRLAEYKYYNMDAVVQKALALAKSLIS